MRSAIVALAIVCGAWSAPALALASNRLGDIVSVWRGHGVVPESSSHVVLENFVSGLVLHAEDILISNKAGRERKGRSLPFVVANEGDAVPYVRDHVGTLATICADEGAGWDALHAGWDTRRVNHSVAFMDEGVCTNQAESYFSRLRRMEVGTHHHIAGPYLASYANEAAWREDNRRVDNGSQAMTLTAAAMGARVSRSWKGYWQRAEV